MSATACEHIAPPLSEKPLSATRARKPRDSVPRDGEEDYPGGREYVCGDEGVKRPESKNFEGKDNRGESYDNREVTPFSVLVPVVAHGALSSRDNCWQQPLPLPILAIARLLTIRGFTNNLFLRLTQGVVASVYV